MYLRTTNILFITLFTFLLIYLSNSCILTRSFISCFTCFNISCFHFCYLFCNKVLVLFLFEKLDICLKICNHQSSLGPRNNLRVLQQMLQPGKGLLTTRRWSAKVSRVLSHRFARKPRARYEIMQQ